jgi:hypothetical protein
LDGWDCAHALCSKHPPQRTASPSFSPMILRPLAFLAFVALLLPVTFSQCCAFHLAFPFSSPAQNRCRPLCDEQANSNCRGANTAGCDHNGLKCGFFNDNTAYGGWCLPVHFRPLFPRFPFHSLAVLPALMVAAVFPMVATVMIYANCMVIVATTSKRSAAIHASISP